jgi:hypothetical protein
MSTHHDHYPDHTSDTATAAGVAGAATGLLLAAMLVIGLLLALFMWSPWNARSVGITPQPGIEQPSGDKDIDVNIRGDIRVPQNSSGNEDVTGNTGAAP